MNTNWNATCSHPRCSRPIDRLRRQLCFKHYMAWFRRNRRRKSAWKATCSLPGCSAPIHNLTKRLCNKHYQRFVAHGDPNVTKRRANGEGCIYANKKIPGYKVRYVTVFCPFRKKKVSTLEHIHLAQVHILGRRLKRGELVHHKDDNPLNNSLSNLQVVTRAQHARIHDLAAKGRAAKRRRNHI